MADQQTPGSAGGEFSARLVAADGTVYELSGEQTLGRSADDDITISKSNISRGHARFRLTDDQLTLEDQGSTNGTSVNHLRTDGVVPLRDGDIVGFDTFELRVELTGAATADAAAAVDIDGDVTVIGSLPEPAPTSAPDSPVTGQEKPDAPAGAAPGSWLDQDDGSGTVVMYKGHKTHDHSPPVRVEHSSELPHLIVFTESGPPQVLELETTEGDKPDVWEIGRDEGCTIVLADDSVSATHAQLIHQNSRWRLVNLVSTNGIYVNGEKRLTAFLADGDEIKLGMARLVFKSGSGAEESAASGGLGGSVGQPAMLALLGAGIVIVAAGLWWLLG